MSFCLKSQQIQIKSILRNFNLRTLEGMILKKLVKLLEKQEKNASDEQNEEGSNCTATFEEFEDKELREGFRIKKKVTKAIYFKPSAGQKGQGKYY